VVTSSFATSGRLKLSICLRSDLSGDCWLCFWLQSVKYFLWQNIDSIDL